MSAARSPRTGARTQGTARARAKATAATGASSAKRKTQRPGKLDAPKKDAAKQAKGKAAAGTTPADPARLVRSAAGRYISADERFTVESDASGTWYVIDQVQKDDFGLPRLLGPHRTLAAARQAIRFARGK